MKRILRLCLFAVIYSTMIVSCGISDRDRADAFAHEIAEWSQQLNTSGKKKAKLISALIGGKESDISNLRRHQLESTKLIRSGIKEFSRKNLPQYAEEYRTLCIDYFQWQISSSEKFIPEVIAIATDQRLTHQTQSERIGRLIREYTTEEQNWKDEINSARKKLYQIMNE